jgi:hypothetical protein
VTLHTTQNDDGPPLIVTYQVETTLPHDVTLGFSFEESVNVGLVPPFQDGRLE